MKKCNILLGIIVAGLCFSCENVQVSEDCSNDALLAGDTVYEHFITMNLDTMLFHSGKCDTVYYYVDLDLNGSYEFRFSSYFCYGLTFYEGAFYLESLGPNSKILLNSSLDSPEVLELNDPIDKFHNAFSGRYEMAKCSGSVIPETGEEFHSSSGIWRTVDMQYIGLVYEDGNYIYNSWLAAGSVNSEKEPFAPYSIILYNIGTLKCCL